MPTRLGEPLTNDSVEGMGRRRRADGGVPVPLEGALIPAAGAQCPRARRDTTLDTSPYGAPFLIDA